MHAYTPKPLYTQRAIKCNEKTTIVTARHETFKANKMRIFNIDCVRAFILHSLFFCPTKCLFERENARERKRETSMLSHTFEHLMRTIYNGAMYAARLFHSIFHLILAKSRKTAFFSRSIERERTQFDESNFLQPIYTIKSHCILFYFCFFLLIFNI